MAITVAEGFEARMRHDLSWIVVRVRADPDLAGEALRRVGAELPLVVERGVAGHVQGVSYTADGAYVTVDGHVLPEEQLTRIPEVVARHLGEVGVDDAVIGEPLRTGGPLFVLDDDYKARAVRARLIAARPTSGGPPAGWAELAASWVSVGLPESHQLWATTGFTVFSAAVRDVPVLMADARRRGHPCFFFAGREPVMPPGGHYPPSSWVPEKVQSDVRMRLGGRFRAAWVSFGAEIGAGELVLSGGGPDSRDEEIDELAEELIAVTDGVSADLAYAFVTTGFVLGPTGIPPADCDHLVSDAYLYQVLGPGHLARLGADLPGGRPLAGGRVGLPVGSAVDWLKDRRDDADPIFGWLPQRRHPTVRQRGRRLLWPCLRIPDAPPVAEADRDDPGRAGAALRQAHERKHAELRRLAALHEAGHAVAAIAAGISVPAVAIVSTTQDPMAHHPESERISRWGLHGRPASADEVRSRVVTVLAGPVAEMMLGPDQVRYGQIALRSWADGPTHLELAEAVVPPFGDADPVLVRCSDFVDFDIARELTVAGRQLVGGGCDPALLGAAGPGRDTYLAMAVDGLGRWRPAVEALADALLEHQALDGPAVHRIVEPLLRSRTRPQRQVADDEAEEPLANWRPIGQRRLRSRPQRLREPRRGTTRAGPMSPPTLFDAPVPLPAAAEPWAGAWSAVAPLPTPRGQPAAASVAGRIYAIGGADPQDGSPVDTVEVYDEAADRWEGAAPLPRPRREVTACPAPDGRIYVFGVGGYDGRTGVVDVYDPVADRWEQAPPVPAATKPGWSAAATGPDGLIYVFSAEYQIDVPPTLPGRVQRLDPVAGQWTRLGTFPKARREFLMAAGGDDRLYLVGGAEHVESLALAEAYDPFDDDWQTVAPMLGRRSGHAVVTGPEGCIYAIGGRTTFNHPPSTTVERYDPWTGLWSFVAALPKARLHHAAAAGAAAIYVLGGLHPGGAPITGELRLEVRDPAGG